MSGSLVLVESNTTGSGREFCAAARRRGLHPVVLAIDPGRYPYLAEDGVEARVVATADDAAVVAHCRRIDDVVGVTSSSEYFVAAAARAAGALGLPAPDPRAVGDCRHKDRQRRRLAAAGVPVPAFRVASTPAAAADAARDLGPPVVVKPTTGSGSAGVRLCATEAEVRRHAARLLASTENERGQPLPAIVLVEGFLDAPELSVETFDGEPVAVLAKHLGPKPYFVETGHDCPAPLDARAAAEVRAVARRAVHALGVGWGAAHTELRLTPDGPVVVEVNARLAGGMIPTLVRLAHGADLVDALVARACGQREPPAPVDGACAAIRFVQARGDGVVVDVSGIERARRVPGVALGEVTTQVGADVRVTRSFRDRLGYVVATGRDVDTAARRAAAAASLIRIEARRAA